MESDIIEKLKELEVQPSERANLLFQEKISSKKRQPNGVIRYFVMAAALLLVLGITVYLSLNPFGGGEHTTQGNTVDAEQEVDAVSEKSEPEKVELNEKNLSVDVIESPGITEVKRVVGPLVEEVIPEEEIPEEVEVEILKRLQIETEFIELAQSPIILSPERDLSVLLAVPEPTQPEILFDFETEERTLLAKLVDEVRFLIRGEDFDADRSGIKPLFQEKSAIFVAETENLGFKIIDLFN